jgi:hypothetical protein
MKRIKTLLIIILTILSTYSCLDLKEELYSSITTDSFYRNETECLLALGNCYASLRQTNSLWGAYSAQVLATDEAVIPLRNAGYSLNNNGVFLSMHKHDFYPQLDLVNGPWSLYFGVAAKCNDVIFAIESAPTFTTKQKMIAELKILRAFSYYNAMDLYGNIPVVLNFADKSLPTQKTRKEAFDIIEKELKDNYAALDAKPSAANYGRCIRPMAFMVLAKMYINAEKWTGTARYADAAIMCDSIINKAYYILEPDFFTNFKILNTGSKENIFVIPYDRTVDSWGFTHNVIGLPVSLQTKYGYNIAWNGICAPPAFYNLYEATDKRIKSFEVGPQFYASGAPVIGLNGSQLTFTNTISNILSANEGEGARFWKYEWPTGLSGLQSMDNDWAVYRYADVLLIKAEAIMRANSGTATQAAVDLVNLVRQRAFGNTTGNYTTTTLTLPELLNERGRELAWEGHRRQDQIRFGTFGNAWFEKAAWTDNHKELYPIPSSPLIANPNLVQNPLY